MRYDILNLKISQVQNRVPPCVIRLVEKRCTNVVNGVQFRIKEKYGSGGTLKNFFKLH